VGVQISNDGNIRKDGFNTELFKDLLLFILLFIWLSDLHFFV